MLCCVLCCTVHLLGGLIKLCIRLVESSAVLAQTVADAGLFLLLLAQVARHLGGERRARGEERVSGM